MYDDNDQLMIKFKEGKVEMECNTRLGDMMFKRITIGEDEVIKIKCDYTVQSFFLMNSLRNAINPLPDGLSCIFEFMTPEKEDCNPYIRINCKMESSSTIGLLKYIKPAQLDED